MTSLAADTRRADLRLPPPRAAFPPATRRSMVRATAVYAGLWALGLLLVAVGGPGPSALGAGLALPGGGQLAAGQPWWALGAAVALLLAVAAWWSMGPTVLPPLVWLAAAAAAGASAGSGSTAGTTAAFAVGPVVIVGSALVHVVRHRSQTRRARVIDQRLARVEMTVAGAPDLSLPLPVAESSPDDLAFARYGLDLALQPLDQFAGFTMIDQFREAALRYQLNALSYGLSMSQFTRTPAFSGYLAEAQRNAIEKMLHRKAWGYWAIENAWGNASLSKDPVDNRDNVMLTGFHGVMIGMYASLNDDRYSSPGALTYTWDERTRFPYDFGELAASIHRNQRRSGYTLFACEPNWIYTICNTYGLNTLLSHDRLHGTSYADDALPRLRAAYESEFLRPDGRIVGVRSKHLGLSWNFWASPSVQTMTTFWLHAGLPDIALRTWCLLREQLRITPEGTLAMPQSLTVRLDAGNYRIGRDTFTQIGTLLAAQEVGDEEYAEAARRTLATREPVTEHDGARRLRDASGLANHYLNLARFGRRDGVRDLVLHGAPDAWRTGPRLAEAGYPDVLVAKAVTDGAALDLVLRPGAGPVRTTLRLDRLRPGARYDVRGAAAGTVVADAEGGALVEVDLGDRLEVRVTPAG